MYDVIVVGGGPPGLSAALMLGRCRRRVLLCDLGEPRNRRSYALHGFLTGDGITPNQLNALGREKLHAYGIEFRHIGVTDANWRTDRFHVTVGRDTEDARFLLLATGVVDDLPAASGLDECYGRSVFHCPYCGGCEWRDGALAVGSGCGTNVPNVFVVGEASRDVQFVVVAAAEGVKAAVTIDQALQRKELMP